MKNAGTIRDHGGISGQGFSGEKVWAKLVLIMINNGLTWKILLVIYVVMILGAKDEVKLGL